jgi:hypothetical protein
MSRTVSVLLAVALALPPVAGFAASAPAKHHVDQRHIYHWHGYGFLPGYQQPPNNSAPPFLTKRSSPHVAERPSGSFPNYHTPAYTPYYWHGSYWYGGGRYYLGNPGFFHGRYNGGSFGPCWTLTPIGPIWNCG